MFPFPILIGLSPHRLSTIGDTPSGTSPNPYSAQPRIPNPTAEAMGHPSGYKKNKIDGILLLIRDRKTAIFRWTSMDGLRLPGNGFDLLFLMFCAIS
jgi:hypothetical protein